MAVPVLEDNKIVATVGLANRAEDYDKMTLSGDGTDEWCMEHD
jgi:hypothetical protein